MNGRVIVYLIGKILYFLGVVFAVPMLLGFGYRDEGGMIFAACMIASFMVGFLLQKLGTKTSEQYNLSNREGTEAEKDSFWNSGRPVDRRALPSQHRGPR